jgi:hypothetical protein
MSRQKKPNMKPYHIALLGLLAFSPVALHAEDKPKPRHNLEVVLRFPSPEGAREIKLPWTVVTTGQSIEIMESKRSFNINLTVGEVGAEKIDLNYYFQGETSESAPNSGMMIKSYSEFEIGKPQAILIDGKQVIEIEIRKR